jgi:hypothetical protein
MYLGHRYLWFEEGARVGDTLYPSFFSNFKQLQYGTILHITDLDPAIGTDLLCSKVRSWSAGDASTDY